MKLTLSRADVERLLTDRSPDVRAETAAKVAQGFADAALSKDARHEAEQIIRALLHDTQVRVRAAIAENLRFCASIPNDVALALARDIEDVSLPILEFSAALTDADLLGIIAESNELKQVAIAKRPTVSADVADALVATECEDVVATLVANDGADIRDATFGRILDAFGENERITTPIVKRKQIPVAVAERLVNQVSKHMRDYLVARHELPPSVATNLIQNARERTTLELSGEENVEELVRSLAVNNRLTSSIVVRALCTGDLAFFEWSLAVMAGIPIASARTLIYDRGELGLRAVWDHSGLPPAMFEVANLAIKVAMETDFDGCAGDRERYVRRMVERVLTNFEDPASLFDPESLEYLLGKISTSLQPGSA